MKFENTICYMHNQIQEALEDAIKAGQKMEDAIHERNEEIEALKEEIEALKIDIIKLTEENKGLQNEIDYCNVHHAHA